LLNLATEKLAARTMSKEDLEEQAALAVLSTRVLLRFSPARLSSLHIQDEMIRAHMRVAYCVPAHLEFCYSSSPSESVLAEAAGRLLFRSEASILWHLSNALSDDLVGHGERGELAWRVLFTLAYNHAVLNEVREADAEPRFHRPVRLLDFLRCLFS
jgi:hypothetical protein